MFENAIRQGLPIAHAAVAANRSNKTLEQEVGTHKINIEAARKILPGDLLHASVKLGPGMPGRTYNNPPFPLSRIDDAGVVTAP